MINLGAALHRFSKGFAIHQVTCKKMNPFMFESFCIPVTKTMVDLSIVKN